MSKVSTLCMIALLLLFTLTCAAARPEPALHHAPMVNTQRGDGEAEKVAEMDESCGGLGEEECLMRRTLAAHIDYIYTQKQKP